MVTFLSPFGVLYNMLKRNLNFLLCIHLVYEESVYEYTNTNITNNNKLLLTGVSLSGPNSKAYIRMTTKDDNK